MRVYKPRRYDFICPNCKNTYEAKNIRSTYCSVSCRVSAFREKQWLKEVARIKNIYKMKQNG